MSYKILLVDDERDFLELLEEFLLEKGYTVVTACGGTEALQLLSQSRFHLIISDIQMPGIKGFELLSKAQKIDPEMKRVLITAYDVRDYIFHAYKHDIGNIITKSVPFDFDEVARLIDRLLSRRIFGLKQHFESEIFEKTISTPKQIESVISDIVESFEDNRQKRSFQMAMREVITNAVFYGAKQECPVSKQRWDITAPLPEGKEVVVSWSRNEEKTGVSVLDRAGLLKKHDILYWLNRNTRRNEHGLILGAYDSHGKGLFIARESIDRLLVNIDRERKTEIIMINYHVRYSRFLNRPLWIQEI